MVRRRQRKRLSKKLSERIHAKRRLLKRYDIAANRDKYKEIKALIKSSKAKFLYRQSLRCTVWAVEYEGRYIKAVYDGKRNEIVTVLPWR